jgi:hypothetical protein
MTRDDISQNVDVAMRFLTALFAPDDLLTFRPVESWIENGRKCSKVHYDTVAHLRAQPEFLARCVKSQLECSEQFGTNVYFGVCPREGGDGQFDQAFQIRKVNTLWSDIDNTTWEAVQSIIEKVGLPHPSVVVNSGNGIHLYWLLDEPFQIDYASTPRPVLTEFNRVGGKIKPRKYVIVDGMIQYLHGNRGLTELSPQAELVQRILKGIALQIGGDHTTDLSRLLRLPGSMNRKDARSGKTPIPTELLVCEPSRRYSFNEFAKFELKTPDAASTRPSSGKRSANKRLDKLIKAAGKAAPGQRSEKDFGVCCCAIQNGVDKDSVWDLVKDVGKFAESGRDYFETTWDNASAHLSTKQPANPTIDINELEIPVSVTLGNITQHLLDSSECYVRTDQLVHVTERGISTILASPELTGLLTQFVEVRVFKDDVALYKPLPTNYANSWLNNPRQKYRLPEIKLFVHNPVFDTDWNLVSPGYTERGGIYYSGQPVASLAGTEHLDRLLSEFCFKTPGDRTNYIGILVTAVLIARFIGSKPAVLFCANQAGLGKTILAQILAILRDGSHADTVSYNPNDEEFEKRLGAVVKRGSTTIVIDNAKSSGRNPKIESACLERSITDPILSYRLLGGSNLIRAENSHIFCITANSPEVSRDLVTRSVIVSLHYEGDPTKRKFGIEDPEGYALAHRDEILGELLGLVQRWLEAGKPMATTNTRFNKQGWGNIVGGILQLAGQPDFLINAEEAAADLDETKRDFGELVELMFEHPQGIWTPKELVEFCATHNVLADMLGNGSERSRTTKFGIIASRFVGERFGVSDDVSVTFECQSHRKGQHYRVLDSTSAEP